MNALRFGLTGLFLLQLMVTSFPLLSQETTCGKVEKGNNQIIELNQYVTYRGLDNYAKMFRQHRGERSNLLVELLSSLGPQDHILDAGSGETNAMAEYLGLLKNKFYAYRGLEKIGQREQEGKANVTAVTFKVKDGEQERMLRSEAKMKLITGRFFEHIDNKELTGFGRPKVILDVWGVLAYTSAPDVALSKYLNILADGGTIFLYVGPQKYEELGRFGLNISSSMYRSEVKTRGGKKLPFPDWIKSIPGLEVIDLNESSFALKIKDRGAVRIPRVRLKETFPGPIPPQIRIFEEI